MKCPHCLEGFHDNREHIRIGEDRDGYLGVYKRDCPACKRMSLWTVRKGFETLFFPKQISRSPLPTDVPEEFAADYKEACLTLRDSPKASAALSRRCLQHILREKANISHGNLANEIQQAIDSKQLPSFLSESIDAIRNIGNFAAHPLKSTSSGEVVPVESGEAEWNLDVIESLFDFYFVQPALLQKKRDALNQKLKAAGKPEMK